MFLKVVLRLKMTSTEILTLGNYHVIQHIVSAQTERINKLLFMWFHSFRLRSIEWEIINMKFVCKCSLNNDSSITSVDDDIACINNVLRWSPFDDDESERHVYEELCCVTFGKEVIEVKPCVYVRLRCFCKLVLECRLFVCS